MAVTETGKPKLQRLSRLRLVDRVYRSLEDAILSGRVQPGERLVEASIAEQLDVGRSTIREAFLMLQSQGLVVSIPRRGTFVTRLSQEDALDLARTRALLEGMAVVMGYRRIDSLVAENLKHDIEQMKLCVLPDDLPQMIRVDLTFHRRLAECARSSRLLDAWVGLNGQIGALYIKAVEEQQFGTQELIRLHQRLLDDVLSGDPGRALRGIVAHYIRPDQQGSREQIESAIALTVGSVLDVSNRSIADKEPA